MTTRGCMLVGYCKARRPTLKTADFADNVLVGHLVSNQPVTGGQTSSLSPAIVRGIPGAGSHFGHRRPALRGERYPRAGSDAACPSRGRELGQMLRTPPATPGLVRPPGTNLGAALAR